MTEKNCNKYRDLFYLGAGKDLPSDLQLDLDKHLECCEECQSEFEKITKINDIFVDVRKNLSKIEDCTNLGEIRKRNINKLKQRLRVNKKRKISYIFNPIAAAMFILIASLSFFLFPDSSNTLNPYTDTKTPLTSPNPVTPPESSIGSDFDVVDLDDYEKDVRKNDDNSKIYELRMKFQGMNQGHYIQGSCIKGDSSNSYFIPRTRVEAGWNGKEGIQPTGFKPAKTKIESSFDENNPKNSGF